MEDMTMGQRIAACRKQLGISQEALGDQMGVSRQAISKWEADGAVPEIDKLIALSKLFSVSVGWLLGVETEAQSGPEKEEVSEELLHKLEQLVQHYVPKKQPLSRKRKILLGIAAGILGLMVLTFIGRWNTLAMNVANLSAQVRNNTEQNAVIMHKLNGLEDQLSEPANAPLRSYTFDIVPIHIESEADTSDAEIYFSAVPAQWQLGDVGILSIRHPDKGTLQAECDWDGSYFTAMIPLGSDYGYELCFTIRHADGTQVMQMLSDNRIENLGSSLTIPFTIRQGHGEFKLDGPDLKLSLWKYTVSVERPDIAQAWDTWDTIEFVLYLHRGQEREIIGTYDLLGPVDPEDEILRAAGIETNGHTAEFILPGAQEGDGLVLWLNIEMSNGMQTFTIIDQWYYRDGAFENSGGEYIYE